MRPHRVPTFSQPKLHAVGFLLQVRALEVLQHAEMSSGKELLRHALFGAQPEDGLMSAIMRARSSDELAAVVKEQVRSGTWG